ncbi:13989_t:CDS:2, partial [Acaulospora colombiana]
MGESNAKAGSWNILEPRLSPFIMEALAITNFSEMTPVQAATIPLFMKHKDVVVEAVTGSGKTLAFVIPIIEKLFRRKNQLAHNEVGALVITPTRELAQQISSVFTIFLNESKLKHALIIGGTTTVHDDISLIKDLGPDIIIGTPGRLRDLLVGDGNKKSLVNAKELEILVLDEADRLLDMGFSQTLNDIIAHLPKQRNTGLFSATMTDGLAEVVRVGLRNPVRVVVKVEDVISKVEQRTPSTGLDVPDVDVVIQMEPPQDPKVFSHRCGRTARAGKEGKAILFLGKGREEVYVGKQSYILPDGNEFVASSSLSNDGDISPVPVVDDENEVLLKKIQSIVLSDRDLHDKGLRAFVSFIRFYSKHELSYIFRLKDLNLGKVAKGYCLLRAALKQRKLERKLKKAKKKEQVKKRKADEIANEFSAKNIKGDEEEGVCSGIEEEWDELQKEKKLIKKLKIGKIDRDEFDQKMASITEK